ncbi:MAG: glycosyltransferase family 2 protein [Methanomassiliicoccales archaeon]|nr:glycosyltransferase family 2 protein [Methanomassiliicoccales archaeon]
MEPNEQKPVLDITVFILSYNRPQYLREMLSSVLSQTALPEEIVILDNGSDNDTRKAVEDLIGGRVRWMGADRNHQSFWNFQRAFSMSERKYFTILHDDDRLLPEFLKTTVGALEADDGLIAITTNGYRIDDQGARMSLKYVPNESLKSTTFHNSKEAAVQYSNSFIPFPNVVYRNGFPQKVARKEEYGKIWDGIFLIDLADQGKITLLNELIFEYRIHQNQDSVSFPEDCYQKKDDYILSKMVSNEDYRTTLKKIQRRQSQRFIGRMMIAFIKKRDPRAFFNENSRLENKYLTARFVIFYLIFEQLDYMRQKIIPR